MIDQYVLNCVESVITLLGYLKKLNDSHDILITNSYIIKPIFLAAMSTDWMSLNS